MQTLTDQESAIQPVGNWTAILEAQVQRVISAMRDLVEADNKQDDSEIM